MVMIGNDFGRKMVHPNLWCICTKRKLSNEPGVINIITDLRYPNEYETIREQSYVIALHRDFKKRTGYESVHALYTSGNAKDIEKYLNWSECAMDGVSNEEFDAILHTDGSEDCLLQQLQEQVLPKFIN
jgi:hypothetical protein